MDHKFDAFLRQMKKNKAKRRHWICMVCVLSLIVAAVTITSLSREAVAKNSECGLEEHTHTAQCYAQVPVTEKKLVCSKESLGVHEHSEACYDTDGNLICGYADYIVHEHDASCYDSEGNLVCQLPEVKEHQHDETCYEDTEQGRVLRCTKPEITLHTHTAYESEDTPACFDKDGNWICGKLEVKEHQHDETCFQTVEGTKQETVLTCTKQEHTHSDLCQGENRLTAEEQLQVTNWNNKFAELPTAAEAQKQLDTFRQAADAEGWEAYLAELQEKEATVQQGYDALTDQQREAVAGYEDMQKLAALWGDAQLTCGNTEANHTHTAWCYRAWQLTDAEQAQVNAVISAINALPSAETVNTTVNSFAPKSNAQKNYVLSVTKQAQAAKNAYDALSALQQRSVSNADKLQTQLATVQTQAAAVGSIGERLDGDYAYISSLSITKTVDGSYPFDDDNTDGNDSSESNGIVRSFDSMSYTLNIRNSVRTDESPYTYYKEGTLCFEFVLPVSKDEAAFEPAKMTWLKAKPYATYEITEETYNGNPAQVLRGSFLWQPSEGNDTAIGESYIELDVFLRVLAMTKGEQFQPLFTFWLEGNQVPTDGCVTGRKNVCEAHGEDHDTVEATPVTVSSTPRFNLFIKDGAQQVLGTFDFSTGNELAFNKDAGKVYGRVSNYGMALQIYGKDKDHGLRGCELPNGKDITFDIQISSSYEYYDGTGRHVIDAAENGFAPLVWSFGQNQYIGKQDDRTISNTRANGKTFNAPYNKLDADFPSEVARSCYDGGTWRAELDADGKTMHITVSGYQVDLNQLPYTSAAASLDDYRYYNPNSISSTGYWDVQQACFAAGDLWIVQPFNDANGVSIASKFKSGSFTMNVKEQKLAAEGQTKPLPSAEDNSNQMVTNDDEVSMGLALQLPGTFSYDIAYQAPQDVMSTGKPWNTPLAYGCWDNGRDWVVAGGQLRVFDYIIQNNCEGDARGVAYDQLVKFDSDFMEPTYALNYYTNLTGYNMTYRAGFGVLAESSTAGSPTTGWNHHGKKPNEAGYDEEMMNATADDLIFFNSMDEVKARGYKCVAVLFELRGACDRSLLNTNAYFRANVTTNQSLTGGVFMITHAASVWTRADVRNTAAEYVGKEPSEVTDEDFFRYATEVFPSRLPKDSTDKKAVGTQHDYTEYPNYPNNYVNQGVHSSNEEVRANFLGYQKSVYDKNGWAGGSSGTNYGDSCILMSYTTSIEKSVTQTTHTGEKKATYSIDDAQRYADFQLIGSANIGVLNQTESSSSWMKTTVYIEDTLPKDLHYVEGSSSYGGVYQQTAEGKRGIVEGGQPITPEVTYNADGTTTLRYTLKNVTLDLNKKTVLPAVYYSCLIGNPNDMKHDVTNTQKLVNTAKIWSTEDYFRPFVPENGNHTTCEINVSKLMQGNISKLADQVYVDAGNDMGFTIAIGNSGANPRPVTALDIIPYHGVNGTTFSKGTACISQVTELTLKCNTAGVDLSQFRVYATTDSEVRAHDSTYYRDMTDAKLLEAGWERLPLDAATGTVTLPDTFEPSAVLTFGELPAGQTLGMHMTMHLTDDVPGDFVVNQLYESGGKDADLLKAQANSYVVSRNLSGLAWLDDNLDGVQNEGDASRISGLKVTLMKLKDGADPELEESYEPYFVPGTTTPVTVETGKQMDARTGTVTDYDAGCYQFTYLPSGTFAVKFENGSGSVDLAPLVASPIHKAKDSSLDSDGIGVYDYDNGGKLLRSVILNISMPEASQMSSTLYESKHNDSGFGERLYEMPETGGSGVRAFFYWGAGLMLLAAALLVCKRKLHR